MTENDVEEAGKEEVEKTELEKEDAIDKEKWHNAVYKIVGICDDFCQCC